jgi:hypothetical protein
MHERGINWENSVDSWQYCKPHMSTLNEQISDMEGLQRISLSATSFDMGATDVERTRECAAPRRPVPTCGYRLDAPHLTLTTGWKSRKGEDNW